MKHLSRLAAVAAFGLTAGSALGAEYVVDASHSNVGFKVRHILTRLPGQFNVFEGTFKFDPKAPEKTAGTFTAKAASIDTNAEKRDVHLRGEDFFWAEKHPNLVLVVKKLTRATGEHRYTADADITIRGVTKPVTLAVEYLGAEKTPWGSTVASFEARGKINRKDFGLNWNKALESGGVLVGDEVELLLDVEGVDQAKTK